MATYFHIQKPKAQGRSFVLSEQTRARDGSSTYRAVESPELDAINRAYRDGVHTFDEAYAQVRALRDRLTRQAKGHKTKPVTHQENLKLVDAYWEAEYADRDLVDASSMRYDLLRAVAELGPISLLVATRQELFKALAHLPPNKQRRCAARLNQLLRFAGSKTHIRVKRPEFSNIRYLTEADALRLADRLPTPIDTLVRLAFASGLRAGEIFGLTAESRRGRDRLWVETQVDDEGERRATKNRKSRTVIVLASGLKALETWIATPDAERQRINRSSLAGTVAAKAEELWPTEPRKHVVFHDLRHSYAIEMLRRGASLTQVAMLLGNSMTVAQAYYTGFSLTDEGVEALAHRLAKR
ncbi:MAG TPA: tyrosine-type recombinase/integrase [Phycisphaerales bacterium]|nr:tyrosine-type recombinase/integrase [Phycisphaerales bacterium]